MKTSLMENGQRAATVTESARHYVRYIHQRLMIVLFHGAASKEPEAAVTNNPAEEIPFHVNPC